ncbi:choice-of-anchor M domain-containing protein [Corynebacterium felinum]|uniref:Surface-anchored protein n=1 Tax=Corynebacterium felinum TaxID=131318 RepID=A0ABU2B934_9CORY|nr:MULTISPECIES: choice-of-anchor M domain-containing protein [Corynebacterium]MDF5821048.1 choice-of-anchor M domain-containing protein [Corynebacterium felinum]MDO4760975.1 choice-of-anchor M domain-containing protein [Corynebacterium sp.]MDR7355122.1 surface-anchored protein [Corynebacterium felinum]WJY94473.1 hypothetical protein CFELI_04200 [Corynebacterium felinum]
MKKIPRTLAACLLAVSLSTLSTPIVSHAGDLNQIVHADEPLAPAGELSNFTQGHADLGPLMVPYEDSAFDAYIRDDTQVPAVWRKPEDVLFVVDSKAEQTLPNTDDFGFVGAKPGQKVWVVPQVEQVGVPWLGWSTQSPAFVNSAVRGVTMTFVGHQGPGQFTLFLQNGGFEKPQLLWTSANKSAQDLWVELNTHTHANWVFTEAGIHNVAIKISAELNDGKTHEVTRVLTFAVGEVEDLPAAQATQWEGEFLTTAEGENPTGDSNAPAQGDNQLALWGLIGVVALLVIVSLVVVFRAMSAQPSKKKKSTGGDNA